MTLPFVRAAVAAASRVVFFTGAGMSAESGIPTFRGSAGLWRGSRPEELATPQAFASDPGAVVDWYRMRRRAISAADPHDGHRAVADYCRQHRAAQVVTQNVDGLHQRAGCPIVEELHGSIWLDRCVSCGFETRVDPTLPISPEGSAVLSCTCGGGFRPGVVWFGETLPEKTLARATAALRAADVVIIVGTSAVVQPAASLVDLAPPDALRVEVNPDPGRHDIRALVGTAAQILPKILAASAS